MKPVRLRPQARQDRRAEVLYYRTEAGTQAAAKLVKAMAKALVALQRNPGIGSPTLGQQIGIDAMRTWRLDGFPIGFWYFERVDHLDIARLAGQRQRADDIAVES